MLELGHARLEQRLVLFRPLHLMLLLLLVLHEQRVDDIGHVVITWQRRQIAAFELVVVTTDGTLEAVWAQNSRHCIVFI